MKKYQKKLLAVIGVLLMIAFVATLSPGVGRGGGGRGQTVVGHLGQTPIYDQEMRGAKDQWQMAMHTPVSDRRFGGQPVPLPYAILPVSLVQDINTHPELFLLLAKEAQGNGMLASEDDARSWCVNRLQMSADVAMADPAIVQAVRNMLTVAADYQHLAQAIKVSQPVWRHRAAAQFQSVRLNLVDFRADEFAKNVPSPSPQQLQEQFDKYKNTPARLADAPAVPSSPLGFGYLVPPRVKLQYVVIPKAQVVESVQGTPDEQYQWAVKAATYYRDHEDEFKNTPAETQPAGTQPSAATSQPASQPAVKPFAEVKAQIIQKLIEPEVQQRMTSIQEAVIAELNKDWIGIRREYPAATQPAGTQPSDASAATTQPADQRMSLARLEQIRADIQQKFHVPIELHEINQWQDAQQLSKLPGIGEAHTSSFDEFPKYALSFTGQVTGVSAVALQNWEASQALTDRLDNAYIFRLTAANPAHPPANISEVAQQVEHDWRVAQAYDLARQAAQKLLDSSKSVGLSQAARTSSLQLVTTGEFAPNTARSIPNYPLTDTTAREDLGKGAQKLLEQASESDKHPEGLIELPTAQRVVVAELAGAQLAFPEWFAQMEVVSSEQQQRAQKLADEWFSYNSVVSRLAYKAEEKAQEGA